MKLLTQFAMIGLALEAAAQVAPFDLLSLAITNGDVLTPLTATNSNKLYLLTNSPKLDPVTNRPSCTRNEPGETLSGDEPPPALSGHEPGEVVPGDQPPEAIPSDEPPYDASGHLDEPQQLQQGAEHGRWPLNAAGFSCVGYSPAAKSVATGIEATGQESQYSVGRDRTQ